MLVCSFVGARRGRVMAEQEQWRGKAGFVLCTFFKLNNTALPIKQNTLALHTSSSLVVSL